MSRFACAITVAVAAIAGAASLGFAADQPPCPQGTIASGSDNVMVEGKQVARAGDATGCGSTVIEGSPDVFINGKRFRPSHEVTHSGTRSRALSGGTGIDASASSAALASTSFTMPVMMSLSWKSFGV